MDRLDLKVGFSCNNRCTFCVQGDKRERIGDRTGDEVLEILERRRADTDSVVFTGGEVTIRDDLVDLVAAAKELGYGTIQVQTNGRRMAYAPYVQALAEAGMTEVAPAVHGSCAAIHDALTRARGAFGQVTRGIQNARRLGLPVITNSVVVRDNVRDLPRLAKLLVSLDVQQIQFAYVHPAGTAAEFFEEVVPRFEDAAPFVHRSLDIIRAAGIRAFAEAIPYCWMVGYEQHVVEGHIPATTIEDAPLVIEDYTAYRWQEGKAHGEPCERCTFAQVCEGPWHEYPEHYGWGEMTARTDDPQAHAA